MNPQDYLTPTEFIDSADSDVQAFAHSAVAEASNGTSRAIKIYYAVRDSILYDPYYANEARSCFRASDCVRAKRGFCIPKAALLAAAARAVGIPARVGYGDVINHLSTKKLLELTGGNLFIWHGYTELYLEDRWVKATPAFNLTLCQRFDVHPLEFDGHSDSLFHEYNRKGHRHMEYVKNRGHFADVPYETILADFKRTYPRWFAAPTPVARGDFANES